MDYFYLQYCANCYIHKYTKIHCLVNIKLQNCVTWCGELIKFSQAQQNNRWTDNDDDDNESMMRMMKYHSRIGLRIGLSVLI